MPFSSNVIAFDPGSFPSLGLALALSWLCYTTQEVLFTAYTTIDRATEVTVVLDESNRGVCRKTYLCLGAGETA